jgi:hypothetical protein
MSARGDDLPTIEVVVYRDGALLLSELVDTEEEARLAVERWSEEPHTSCEVRNLVPHPDDEREPALPLDDGQEPT